MSGKSKHRILVIFLDIKEALNLVEIYKRTPHSRLRRRMYTKPCLQIELKPLITHAKLYRGGRIVLEGVEPKDEENIIKDLISLLREVGIEFQNFSVHHFKNRFYYNKYSRARLISTKKPKPPETYLCPECKIPLKFANVEYVCPQCGWVVQKCDIEEICKTRDTRESETWKDEPEIEDDFSEWDAMHKDENNDSE